MRTALAVIAVLIAACAPRWGRHPSQLSDPGEPETFLVHAPRKASSSAQAQAAAAALPRVDPAEREVRYYSDLGPDTIDVAAYPIQQRYNYEAYARTCARCHSLARSINAPPVGREYWDLYMTGMRILNRAGGNAPFTSEERKAVLDFLEFDAKIRKVDRRAEFEAVTDELQARYSRLIDARMERLQRTPRPSKP